MIHQLLVFRPWSTLTRDCGRRQEHNSSIGYTQTHNAITQGGFAMHLTASFLSLFLIYHRLTNPNGKITTIHTLRVSSHEWWIVPMRINTTTMTLPQHECNTVLTMQSTCNDQSSHMIPLMCSRKEKKLTWQDLKQDMLNSKINYNIHLLKLVVFNASACRFCHASPGTSPSPAASRECQLVDHLCKRAQPQSIPYPHTFQNKMITDFNVLSSFMVDKILGEGNCILVINLEQCRMNFFSHEICKQSC